MRFEKRDLKIVLIWASVRTLAFVLGGVLMAVPGIGVIWYLVYLPESVIYGFFPQSLYAPAWVQYPAVFAISLVLLAPLACMAAFVRSRQDQQDCLVE